MFSYIFDYVYLLYYLYFSLAVNTAYIDTVTKSSCIHGSAGGMVVVHILYKIPSYYCSPRLVSEGIIRFYRNGVTSSSYYYGIVQIWYNGQWGNICDDHDYNQYEADVICHQLGYTGASSYSRAGLVRWSYYYVD